MINTKQHLFNRTMKCIDNIKMYYHTTLAFSHSLGEINLARRYHKLAEETRQGVLALAGEVDDLTKKSERLERKLSEKELAYDEIAQALLNTEIGKAHYRDNTTHPDILSHIDAVIIIQSLDQELQQYAVLDDIPFGAAEPEHEASELQRRVAELEMQLDFERSHKSDLQLACLNFCAGITADIQRNYIGGGK